MYDFAILFKILHCTEMWADRLAVMSRIFFVKNNLRQTVPKWYIDDEKPTCMPTVLPSSERTETIYRRIKFVFSGMKRNER